MWSRWDNKRAGNKNKEFITKLAIILKCGKK